MAESTRSVSTMESASPAGEDTGLGCGGCGQVTFGGTATATTATLTMRRWKDRQPTPPTVFSAYVTANGQAWADFDVYMPDRRARDMPRRRAAGNPDDLQFATKPQLAMQQLGRLTAAGLPVKWVAFDEVYGRSEELRKKAAKAGLSYVAIIPCDYQVTLPSGAVIRADEAVKDAILERRSCGNGSKGPRYSEWAMTATGIKGQYLLIRRLISRPDQLTFHLCWAPPDQPATMTYFITIAGRRWPVKKRSKRERDVYGWDQTQVRSWNGICRHTALAALAQLRAAAIRNALTGRIQLRGTGPDTSHTADDSDISDADLLIPLGDVPVPVRGGQPCPPGIAPIRLSIAETARLAGLARQYAAGLISRARLAFALHWSLQRRRHQASARWHHYSARLLAITRTGVTSRGRKAVTQCNNHRGTSITPSASAVTHRKIATVVLAGL